MQKLMVNSMMHEIEVYMSAGALPIAICVRCGASAEALPRGLSKACPGHCQPQAKVRLERLTLEGRHPKEERLGQELRYHEVHMDDVFQVDQVVLEHVAPLGRRLFRSRRGRRA